uniref:Serpentine receptor class gamma n=1 Tax=Caenorhabditis tropicalis TaxID=1561998 RepID=A0A1I7V375_9PELO
MICAVLLMESNIGSYLKRCAHVSFCVVLSILVAVVLFVSIGIGLLVLSVITPLDKLILNFSGVVLTGFIVISSFCFYVKSKRLRKERLDRSFKLNSEFDFRGLAFTTNVSVVYVLAVFLSFTLSSLMYFILAFLGLSTSTESVWNVIPFTASLFFDLLIVLGTILPIRIFKRKVNKKWMNSAKQEQPSANIHFIQLNAMWT